MKLDWSFPKQIFIALIIIGCVGGVPLFIFGTSEIARAAIVGAVLTTVNVLLGYAAIEYSFEKSMTTFFKYVLGGMGLRLLAMVGVFLLLIKIFQYHAGALVTSIGVFYVVFLTLEILFIQKKVNIRNN